MTIRTTIWTATTMAFWAQAAEAQGIADFQPPFRIQTVSEAYVDVGDGTGYAGPALGDVDGDGRADVIVGQFDGGRFRVFKNVGRGGQQAFADFYFNSTIFRVAVSPRASTR